MKEKIRNYIKNLNADDVGFASLKDYLSPNTPNVESYFPEAKSIIVMAYRGLSTCESIDPLLAMNGRMDKDEVMRCDSYKAGHILEDEFNAKIISIPKALPISKIPSIFSIRHAAVAAGLGTFGRHNLVIHPKFGTRVTFSAIITNLELESDEPVKKNLCNNCNICVKNCPAKALDEEGKTDVLKCMKVSQPYFATSQLQFLSQLSSGDNNKKIEMIKNYWPYYQANSIGFQYYCFNCFKLCPACLEHN